MRKRLYQKKTNTTIKMRLQHTGTDGDISPLLETLAQNIDKSALASFSAPRLGTNPKYDGQQATAMYLELDYDVVKAMFLLIRDKGRLFTAA